jgi:hypothetical protein
MVRDEGVKFRAAGRRGAAECIGGDDGGEERGGEERAMAIEPALGALGALGVSPTEAKKEWRPEEGGRGGLGAHENGG